MRIPLAFSNCSDNGLCDSNLRRVPVSYCTLKALIAVHRKNGKALSLECKVDTGTKLSYFPHVWWKEFADSIVPLYELDSTGSLTVAERRPRGVSRHTVDCYIGAVRLSIMGGLEPMGPLEVVGYFEKEPELAVATGAAREKGAYSILLGLGGNAVDGMIAVIDAAGKSAYLELARGVRQSQENG